MSYILDALRKAAEQRGSSTSVLFRPAPTQIGVARSWRPIWIAVGVLLLANAAVMAYLFRPGREPQLPPRTASEPAATTAVAPAPAASPKARVVGPAPSATVPSAPAVRSAVPVAPAPSAAAVVPAPTAAPLVPAPSPAPVVTAPPPSAAPSVASPQRPADLVPPSAAPVVRPTQPPPAASRQAKASRLAPTEPRVTAPERSSASPASEPTASPRTRSERQGAIETLPPATSSLPPAAGGGATGDRGRLKLEVVSYADAPAQRLVFISGRKYVEGDTIEGGYRVEQIREDSVILSDRGERFTLR